MGRNNNNYGKKNNKNNNSGGRYLSENGNPLNGAQMGFSSKSVKSRDAKSDALKSRKNAFWINGWNLSKSRGKITFSGFENSKSTRYKGNQNQKNHITLFVEIFYHRTGSTVVEYVDVCLDSGTCVMKKINMFVDCSINKGGSWTNIVKKMS